MNINPNAQAGLDCSLEKAAWDDLLSCYAQADPIAQNLAQSHLHAKHYMEGGTETVPSHIAELQRLRETCGGLGVHGCTICRHDHTIHAYTLMGPSNRNPGRDPGP